MKVAIYARVSTDEQNADTQVKMCADYCFRNGYEVYTAYVDTGVSGTKSSRPEFDRMLSDMRQMKFNCVMVTKLDRIGRSLQHILSLFTEFSGKGIHFVATTQNIDTSTAAGKLQMQIIGAFAEFERNIISERTKEAIKDNPKVGKRGKDKKPRQKRGGLRTRTILPEKSGSYKGTLLKECKTIPMQTKKQANNIYNERQKATAYVRDNFPLILLANKKGLCANCRDANRISGTCTNNPNFTYCKWDIFPVTLSGENCPYYIKRDE